MSDYDFKSLSDKEFEQLCVDVISELEGRRFERFKPGKDKGVDGRFFAPQGGEVIVQCKHWANTPIETLVRRLKSDELPKIKRLSPSRYIVAVSNALSRTDKAAIQEGLSPYVKSPSDVLGREDINDAIRRYRPIEERHYKLWLSSSTVLLHMLNKPIFERSAFSVEEIMVAAKKYVPTVNHDAALNKLEQRGSVIVTGEPGIGKTTLAEHLCLHYVAKGFEFFKIVDEIKEAESVFIRDVPQIFYFDDFLGRNYLEALSGHEGAHITNFIRRVSRDGSKRFVLTSRSTILNQGRVLIDSFQNQKIDRNEFEIKMASLTQIDRARILYSHIWHSDLAPEIVDEIYKNKRYRDVVAHQNYNPRLISFITDSDRLLDVPVIGYWSYVKKILDCPIDVWENPFVAQQDDFGRAIVLLVALNGRGISQGELAEAFARFVSLPQNAAMNGRKDFLTNLRHLTGSLLNRQIFKDVSTEPFINLFNPSIGDFILGRVISDAPLLRVGFLSLRSTNSLSTLSNLRSNNLVTAAVLDGLIATILEEAVQCRFTGFSAEYISSASVRLMESRDLTPSDRAIIEKSIAFVVQEEVPSFVVDAAKLWAFALEHKMISEEKASAFVKTACENNATLSELEELGCVVIWMEERGDWWAESKECIQTAIVQYFSGNLDGEVDEAEVFDGIEYQDYRSARANVEHILQKKIDKIGFGIDGADMENLVDEYDVKHHHAEYFSPSSNRGNLHNSRVSQVSVDEIDDLFDRS